MKNAITVVLPNYKNAKALFLKINMFAFKQYVRHITTYIFILNIKLNIVPADK